VMVIASVRERSKAEKNHLRHRRRPSP
jgi:hypothetical protein